MFISLPMTLIVAVVSCQNPRDSGPANASKSAIFVPAQPLSIELRYLRTEGPLFLTLGTKTGEAGARPDWLLEIRTGDQVLDVIALRTSEARKDLVPRELSPGQAAVAVWTQARGFAELLSVGGKLAVECDDWSNLSLGVEVVRPGTLPESRPFESIVSVETVRGLSILLFDASGLVGVRLVTHVPLETPEQESSWVTNALGSAAAAIFVRRHATEPGSSFRAASCCISCGGSGHCCCDGTPCHTTDRTAVCPTESCACQGSNCACKSAPTE